MEFKSLNALVGFETRHVHVTNLSLTTIWFAPTHINTVLCNGYVYWQTPKQMLKLLFISEKQTLIYTCTLKNVVYFHLDTCFIPF